MCIGRENEELGRMWRIYYLWSSLAGWLMELTGQFGGTF